MEVYHGIGGPDDLSRRPRSFGRYALERFYLTSRHKDAEPFDFPFELDPGMFEDPRPNGLTEILEIITGSMADIDHEVAVE